MSLAVTDLRKSYAGVPVLRGVDLSVSGGEVHALLGANGAGKSTLIKCLSGATRPDSGTISVGTAEYQSLTTKQARRAGIAVVYQDLSGAESLTVSENVFLGQELRRGPFIRRADQERITGEWIERLGGRFGPRQALTGLSNADLQLVEIIKALRSDPAVLVLDEPTAALTLIEADALIRQVISLKSLGLPILYVTHRISEVFEIADQVTVLSGGLVGLAAPVGALTSDDVVSAIAGRAVDRARGVAADPAPGATALVSARGLLADGIGPIDLDLYAGEVLGVYGLVGSGRTQLCEALSGARRLAEGSVRVAGQSVRATSPHAALRAGVAIVPSDRQRRSVFPILSARDNVVLPSMRPLAVAGGRRRAKESALFDRSAQALDLQPRSPGALAQSFSGGNQQKLVVGRWLYGENQCQVMLFDEPTQGVDVGARSDIYRAITAAAASGKAVLVTSSEPEELVQIAGRVVVLEDGRIAGVLSGDDVTEEALLSLAHRREPAPAVEPTTERRNSSE
jgi:ribose transport system ATP-binding protein